MRRGLLILVTVMVVAAMATVQPVKLKWSNGTWVPKFLTGATACTTAYTQWVTSPYLALAWQGYMSTLHDSGRFDVVLQWSGNGASYDHRLDTVLTGCFVDGQTDSLRSLARHWCEEFFPRLSTGGRFIFKATTGNRDSLKIDSLFFLPDEQF